MRELVRIFRGAIGLALLALIWVSDSAFADKRVALVIGNSAYREVSRLPNPENDARAIGKLLQESGFDSVEILKNVGIAELRRAVGDFAAIARTADIAVVYFAGHGIEVDGTNFLIPVDAKLGRDFDVEDEALSLDRVLKTLEPARRLRLVILDACRENPFGGKMKRTANRSVNRGLSRVEPNTADTLVAYAAKAGTIAEDGVEANSPFTSALLRHLTVPGLDLRLALGRVRDDVIKVTRNKQEPFVYGSLGGNIVSLNAASAPAADAVVAVEPSLTGNDATISAEYALVVRIGTVEAYDAFLVRHPTGYFADLVKAQRDKLAEAEKQVANRRPGELPSTSSSPSWPPAAFNDYRGQVFEINFRQQTHEIAPRRATWPLMRRYKIQVRSERELVTNALLRSEASGGVRSYESTTELDADKSFVVWRMRGEELVAAITERNLLILKLSIKRSGKSCAATATFENFPGREHFKLIRWRNGETMTVDWIKADTMSCRLVTSAPESAATRR